MGGFKSVALACNVSLWRPIASRTRPAAPFRREKMRQVRSKMGSGVSTRRRIGRIAGAASCAVETLEVRVLMSVNVTSYHYDQSETGAEYQRNDPDARQRQRQHVWQGRQPADRRADLCPAAGDDRRIHAGRRNRGPGLCRHRKRQRLCLQRRGQLNDAGMEDFAAANRRDADSLSAPLEARTSRR